jgi:hypothetical protein
MKKGLAAILVLLCSILNQNMLQADEYATLTITVTDVYGVLIDDARVSVNYVYSQDEDVDIPDQFTVRGSAAFRLETERDYTISVTKAGFLSHTEKVELEEDTTLTITLEYAQNIPVLHMKRFSVTPQEVQPGEQFQLYVVIENEGTGDALNVKVTFDPADNFSPVQPSSSAYFGRLDVDDLTSLKQTFVVSGEALSGVYDLTLTVLYSDAAGQSYSVQETVGITILRKPLVKLLNASYPEETEQGELFTFSVEIGNIGRFDVNGLYLEVESDMDWEYYSYYIGSLEAGDFDTFESDVLPEHPGDYTFVIRVGYVDDFNKEHYQEESFSISVTEKVQQTTPVPQEKGLWQQIIDFLKSFLGLD